MNFEIADHLTKEKQQAQGSFYTPVEISINMAKKLGLKQKGKILDSCCGKGNLFVAVLNEYDFISNDDLYGVDIDAEAIAFCINKFPGGHFQVGNCLEDDLTDDDFWKKDPFEKYVPKPKSLISMMGKMPSIKKK
jgi:type I restriction-modification system DNA methylase subunit